MIKNYVFYDFKGEITGVITQDAILPVPSGTFIEVADGAIDGNVGKYFVRLPDGPFDPRPPSLQELPSETHPQAVFNYTTEEWQVTDAVKNEVALSQVRSIRNELLATSDWTQGNDSPLTSYQQGLWATYRAELRDITTTYANVLDANDVTWPTAPATATDDFGGGYDPNEIDVNLFGIR